VQLAPLWGPGFAKLGATLESVGRNEARRPPARKNAGARAAPRSTACHGATTSGSDAQTLIRAAPRASCYISRTQEAAVAWDTAAMLSEGVAAEEATAKASCARAKLTAPARAAAARSAADAAAPLAQVSQLKIA
jgi:hypothetical protein